MGNKLIPLAKTSIALAKTTTAIAITNKLTFNQNRKMVKEIFITNPKFFVDYVCFFYYPLPFWYNIHFPHASTMREFEIIRQKSINNEKAQILVRHRHSHFRFYDYIKLSDIVKNTQLLPNNTNLKIENYKLFLKSKYYSNSNALFLDEELKNKYKQEIDWNNLLLNNDDTFWSEDLKKKYKTRIEQINLFEYQKIDWNIKMLIDFVEYYEGISFPNENIWSILEPYVDDDLIEELFGKREGITP